MRAILIQISTHPNETCEPGVTGSQVITYAIILNLQDI